MSESVQGIQRIRSVDIARGIAILCIIAGHMGDPTINRVVFTFHVTIFYLITGYFLDTKKGIGDFVRRRAGTLLIPYFFACAVIIVLGAFLGLVKGHGLKDFLEWTYASVYGAGDTYTDPFYIRGIGAIWFLWATFWGSMFLRISLACRKWMQPCIVVSLFLLGYYSRSLFWFPLSIQAGMCAMGFMYLGYLFKTCRDRLMRITYPVRVAGLLMAVCVWVSFIIHFRSFWLVHCDIGRGLIDIFGTVCACAVVMVLSRLIDRRTKYLAASLAYLGKCSIIVLCVHIVELNLFPWWKFAARVTDKYGLQLIGILCGKFLLDIGLTILISCSPLSKSIFRMKRWRLSFFEEQ